MSESMRIAGWQPGPVGGVRVPRNIEYRYCPTDVGHWRVEGRTCPVCKAEIQVLDYSLSSPRTDLTNTEAPDA